MSLTNPNKVITEERLSEFYQNILPYLGGMPKAIANKFSKSDLYSTTEKIVGCWTDGRPLYQKTVSFPVPVTTTPGEWVIQEYSFSSYGLPSTISRIINIEGYIHLTDDDTYRPLNMTTYNNGGILCIAAVPLIGTKKMRIFNSMPAASNQDAIMTVSYTKSSDAANSFNFSSETDYSTSEKIVGTWIDGSKLYQRTFTGTVPTVTTQGTSVDAYVSIGASVKRCIDYKGDMLLSNGNNAPIIYYSEAQNTANKLIGINMLVCTNSASSNANKIRIRSNSLSYNNASYTITLQYTKTTD